MRFSIIILLSFPFLMLPQGIKIEHLSDAINSYGSEFNFVQVDENIIINSEDLSYVKRAD